MTSRQEPAEAARVESHPMPQRWPLGRLAREALITRAAPRAPLDALLWLVVLALAAAFIIPGAFFRKTAFPVDGHAGISLNEAVSAAYCGAPGKVSLRYDVGAAVAADRHLLVRPIPQIVASLAGSVPQYCESATTPFLNNENSLMLLMRATLSAWPNATPVDLAHVLSGVQLAMVLLFGYAMLAAGCAVPLTLAALLAIFDVQQDMRIFQYTIYSFFVPDLLMAAACYVLAVRHQVRTWWFLAGSCVAAGVLSAFWANMRSSHLPAFFACFLVFVIVSSSGLAVRRRTLWIAAAVLCFIVGYGAFLRVFIRPLVPPPGTTYQNSSHHVIAHPLVLSLALPPNALSMREGIRWNDAVGLELARRTIPDAEYLGTHYEEALFLYYVKLWLLYPRDMLAVYRAKIGLAGTGVFGRPNTESIDQRTARAVRAVLPLTDGWHIVLLFCAACLLSAWRVARRRSAVALTLLLLSVAALAVLVEAIIIMPEFHLQYGSYLLVYSGIAVAWAAQMVIDSLARLLPLPRAETA